MASRPWRRRFQGRAAEGTVGGEKVLALKPQTFMNVSRPARSAKPALLQDSTAADVIVIHDEIDLAPGKVRVKQGGGRGGHNGLRSIDAHLGTDYWRVRLGVGHPGDKDLVHGYVLHDFDKADQSLARAAARRHRRQRRAAVGAATSAS